MRTKNASRRSPAPAARTVAPELPVVSVIEDEDEAPCSEYVVMSQAREMPALQEHLLEHGERTLH